jgi:hypothetical protein
MTVKDENSEGLEIYQKRRCDDLLISPGGGVGCACAETTLNFF